MNSNNRKIKKNQMYNSIMNLKDEFNNYKSKCSLGKTSKSGDYTKWKSTIIRQLRTKDWNELENYKHYLILLKRIEETTSSIPETWISFLFGGASVSLLSKQPCGFEKNSNNTFKLIYEKAYIDKLIPFISIILVLCVLVSIHVKYVRKKHIKIEFYEDVIEIIQGLIENNTNME